ncbi:MAG: ATP synthase F1 subunit epsilon [Actinomycetota bacterium]
MEVQLVSPEQVLYTGEAEMVVARTLGGGEIAFLRGHAPFIGALDNAIVRVQAPGGELRFAVHGGFVEVSADQVIILSDVAEVPEAIDLERAFAAKARAEEVLRTTPDDYDATIALQRAETRIAVGRTHPA